MYDDRAHAVIEQLNNEDHDRTSPEATDSECEEEVNRVRAERRLPARKRRTWDDGCSSAKRTS